jgi:hypothetical protein
VHSQALGHYEAQSYQPIPEDYSSELDNHLERLQQFKSALSIPVIASLNSISTSGWIDTGMELLQAGADALELNVYYIAADPDIIGEEVENRYLHLLNDLPFQSFSECTLHRDYYPLVAGCRTRIALQFLPTGRLPDPPDASIPAR